MQLFYIPVITDIFSIEGEEVKHISKVLRKSVGDTIQVTDGKGKGYHASIVGFDKNQINCQLGEEIINDLELSIRVHLAVSPTKNNDRYEWLVEKAVELGVTEITPLIGKHSERRKINLDRLQKIAISAMKQSGRFFLPIIHDVVEFKKFESTSDQIYFAHCREGEKRIFSDLNFSKDITILIGPEGDFSNEEIEECNNKNYIPIELGNTRLRTETAALYALAIVKAN